MSRVLRGNRSTRRDPFTRSTINVSFCRAIRVRRPGRAAHLRAGVRCFYAPSLCNLAIKILPSHYAPDSAEDVWFASVTRASRVKRNLRQLNGFRACRVIKTRDAPRPRVAFYAPLSTSVFISVFESIFSPFIPSRPLPAYRFPGRDGVRPRRPPVRLQLTSESRRRSNASASATFSWAARVETKSVYDTPPSVHVRYNKICPRARNGNVSFPLVLIQYSSLVPSYGVYRFWQATGFIVFNHFIKQLINEGPEYDHNILSWHDEQSVYGFN